MSGSSSSGNFAGQSIPKINQLLTMMNECNQVLVRANEEKILLEEICHIIIRDGGYRFVWIGFFDPSDLLRLEPVVYKGFDSDHQSELWNSIRSLLKDISMILPSLQSGQPFLLKNIAHQPENLSTETEARSLDYKSMLILPLTQGPQLMGVLTIYSVESDWVRGEGVKIF